jgi:hypothetical protein
MIKEINVGKYLSVSGGQSSMPYISPGSMGAGMLRWNSNTNSMEVNDGSIWKQIGMNYATLELSSEAITILNWAKKKMDEENQLDELCK